MFAELLKILTRKLSHKRHKNSPENVGMRQFIEELNFTQHIGSIRSKSIHLEHHHFTGYSVRHLEQESELKCELNLDARQR